VITKSTAKKVYKIEKDIHSLLQSNAPLEEIEAQVMKLRKYSY